MFREQTSQVPSKNTRTAKITIDVSFYDERKENLAANRSTTLHFDSWEKASLAFEKARGTIIAESPLSNMESAITPTPPKTAKQSKTEKR
jgi:hypothetical protein